MEYGLAWCVLSSTPIRVITVAAKCCGPMSYSRAGVHNVSSAVMTRIVVSKSKDHAKPHFDLFLTTISTSKLERELKKAFRDTLTLSSVV